MLALLILLAGPCFAAGLQGMYAAVEARNQFNVMTKLYDYRLIRTYLIFGPDGMVYRGLPAEGDFDRFDFRTACAAKPESCGRYSVEAGRLRIEWSGGQRDDRPMEAVAWGFKLGPAMFGQVKRAEAGLRLSGAYAMRSMNGAVAGQRAISFAADGRFQMEGFAGFSVNGPVAAAAGSESTRSTGVYSIRGFTLDLRFDDGRREQHAFLRWPREEDQVIVIAGVSYLRRADPR